MAVTGAELRRLLPGVWQHTHYYNFWPCYPGVCCREVRVPPDAEIVFEAGGAAPLTLRWGSRHIAPPVALFWDPLQIQEISETGRAAGRQAGGAAPDVCFGLFLQTGGSDEVVIQINKSGALPPCSGEPTFTNVSGCDDFTLESLFGSGRTRSSTLSWLKFRRTAGPELMDAGGGGSTSVAPASPAAAGKTSAGQAWPWGWIMSAPLLAVCCASTGLAFCVVRRPARRPPSARTMATGKMRGPEAKGAPGASQSAALALPSESSGDMSDFVFGENVTSNIKNIIDLARNDHLLVKRSQIKFTEGDRAVAPTLDMGDGLALAHGWLTGAEVVVKTAEGGQARGVLINEVRLMRRLRHTNIALFRGIMRGDVEGSLCVVTEWIQDGDLHGYMQRRLKDRDLEREAPGPAPEHYVLTDVARGMQFAHSQPLPVLHLDLEPASVLVDMSVTPPRAKVANFGFGVLLRAGSSTSREPRWQHTGGWAFAAPELAEGGPFGASADVFSFGRLAQALLGAVQPEAAGVWQPLEDLPPCCSGLAGMRRAAALCLAEEPSARPNFTAVCKELMAFEAQGLTSVGG